MEIIIVLRPKPSESNLTDYFPGKYTETCIDLPYFTLFRTFDEPVAVSCPQQMNSFDCGVYVINFSSELAKRYCSDDFVVVTTSWIENTVAAIKPADATNLRQRMFEELSLY